MSRTLRDGAVGNIGEWFFFSSRRRHTRSLRDWSSDVCSSDLDSPLALLCDNPWRPGLERGRALDLQRALGRTLASVAPRELPGFEPWPGSAAEGLADPARAALYREILREESARADELLGERLGRALARQRGDPTGLEPAEERELAQLDSA